MAHGNITREEIKGLVRKALGAASVTNDVAAKLPKHVVVNSIAKSSNKEFDRDESSKSLLTEDDFRGLGAGATVRVAENGRLTSLASDFVKEREIKLVKKSDRESTLMVRSVGIGCDHGGYEVKEQLKIYLAELGLNVRDFGTNSKDAVDYPDFAHAVAEAVSQGSVEIGIVIDGAGIGSAMVAGKVPGVRPAACYSVALAQNSRLHNDANLLSLGSGQNSFEEIKDIVRAFISNEIKESRHKKRVGKIDSIERQYRNSK